MVIIHFPLKLFFLADSGLDSSKENTFEVNTRKNLIKRKLFTRTG